jgi:hypothetical protein
MQTVVGRNDPCPCGSGKKFKRCCLEKENHSTFTPAPTNMPEHLRRALEGRQFNSLEEAQAFLDQHFQQQNRQRLDKFHGLSPEQIHQMLYFPFASPAVALVPEVLDATPAAPILTLFGLLADGIGEQGLKPTAKGNLPRNFCRETALAYWGEQRYQEKTRYGDINREMDISDLHVTRLVAELAGLIRKYKGRFILSRDCRRLLAGSGMSAIYPKLFRAHVEQFNWAYLDRYAELQLIQNAFLFTLYLITTHGEIWRPQTFYEDAFLGAFPMLLDEVPQIQILSPEEMLRSCYTARSLLNFVRFLGLATVEPASDKRPCCEYRVKSLPLLQQVVQFQRPSQRAMSNPPQAQQCQPH